MKHFNSLQLIWVLLGLLLASGAGAATYKWVDKDGQVHYSDTPVEGAERVDLPELPTYAAPAVPAPRKSGEEKERPDARPEYGRFEFVSPKPDQVFWNIAGELPVQLMLEPGLQNGDRINVYLDGKLTENSPTSSLSLTLTEVWRGEHSLRAVVVDAKGTARITAESGPFHVKQHSIQQPSPLKGGN